VTKYVGHALLLKYSRYNRQVIGIGVAPLGITENCKQLSERDFRVPYDSMPSLRSEYALPNNRHAYFLLADKRTSQSYEAKLVLRRKLEKYISTEKLEPGVGTSHNHTDGEAPSITVERTSILLGQQTPRGKRRQFLYTAVRHSVA
jgi:hypothetical protein